MAEGGSRRWGERLGRWTQRPGLRPMRALPMLEPRRASLEKCVFCPKLCRTACPVSNAEPRETLTPWGKMSLAWMTAHGDVPVDRSHAAPAWACTGCYACRGLCDHRNPVADVLLDTRAAMVPHGVAPEGAQRVLAGFAAHDGRTRTLARRLAAEHRAGVLGPDAAGAGTSNAGGRTALLVGCGYLRAAPGEARHALEAALVLAGGPVAVVEGCCGLPLQLAGDADGFRAHASALAQALASAGATRILVVDAGCALALRRRYPDAGVELPRGVRVDLLVEVAAEWLGSRRGRAGAPGAPGDRAHGDDAEEIVQWHDPCQLGRGLGVYDAPRAILAHVLGRPPGEFASSREHAVCSGAGGLLPATMPQVARTIADGRLAESPQPSARRPVRIVTGCASSLMAFRSAAARLARVPADGGEDGRGGAEASEPTVRIEIDDVVSWIARAVQSH